MDIAVSTLKSSDFGKLEGFSSRFLFLQHGNEAGLGRLIKVRKETTTMLEISCINVVGNWKCQPNWQ